jgi:hypothetical protein
VEVGDDPAHLGSEAALQRYREGLDEADLDAEAATARRHLCSDEAGSHHCDAPRCRLERGADGKAVLEGAQRVHALDVVGARKTAGRGSGREHQPVVGQPLAAGHEDRLIL